ncbi:hypothetical protein RKE38_12400 [Phycicoccus sp. M110.8]|uniref:hypothetical protein n=1 Tax=Phycicoccus sp. M110.8 TaxID=3075433 RepID=UPI0028FD0E3A|nr:hypothetical protein [Phycicoccus sp. M110.8]MDU0314491.1 hypothetical protein [Phycicoccus sp. M110.8]
MVYLVPAGSGAGTYLDWGVVHLSLTNAVIIVLMLVLFAAALLLPFPGATARSHDTSAGVRSAPPTASPGSTGPGSTAPAAPGSPDEGTEARR